MGCWGDGVLAFKKRQKDIAWGRSNRIFIWMIAYN